MCVTRAIGKPLAACRKRWATCFAKRSAMGRASATSSKPVCMWAWRPPACWNPWYWLYRLTGEKRYGDFCKYFLGAWEQPNGPHIVSRLLDGKGVNKVGNGKAYEMLSCINGLLEWYRTTGKPSEYLLGGDQRVGRHPGQAALISAGDGQRRRDFPRRLRVCLTRATWARRA